MAEVNELSSCALFDCRRCKFRLDGTCPGCTQGNGFLEAWGRTPCAIFSCVRSRGVDSCKECDQMVCTLHQRDIETICPLRGGLEDKEHWITRIAHHLSGKGGPCHSHPSLPLKTLMRFRWYVAALEKLSASGTSIVSSRELADSLGMSSAMVRKDFSHVGELGTPGLGYQVNYLLERIREVLDMNTCLVVWIGAEWLSNTVGMLDSTLGLNFRIIAALDTRSEWIGKKIGEWEILSITELPALLSDGSVDGAVLALPEDAARVADALVQAGVKGILNLTPVTLKTPPEVNVRHVDLLGEMMAMAMECSNLPKHDNAEQD